MKIKFSVKGMTCAACSARVEKVAKQVPGVENVDVNLLAGTMVVTASSEGVIEPIVTAISHAGYIAAVEGKDQRFKGTLQHDAMREMKIRIIASAVLLLILMYFTMGHMIHLPLPVWYCGVENALVAILVQLIITAPIVYLNRAYYSRGLKALWHRSPNMDSLIAVGSGAALIYGLIALFRAAYAIGHNDWDIVKHYSENLYFESAAMILTLITLGKYLEACAKGKTSDAIRQLMDLRPKTAVRLQKGIEQTIPVEEVQIGDIIVVRSGGSIPIDGTIIDGRGAVDQSALTGESVPVEKTIGDTVAAATINTEGYLKVRVDKIGEDTTLSQVIRMVEEAGGSKAPIARLADKIAGVFVPAVMGISLIAFIVWLILGEGLEFSLNTAIAVLVISCPCALGLATPVAIMVGTGRGARMGVLFKNAESLENLHKIDTVVLDKTGTITKGKPTVTDVIPCSLAGKDLLQIAAALEVNSEHPFARAILDYHGCETLMPICDFETLPGQGVSGVIAGTRYYGGNRKLMEQLGVVTPEYPELATHGKTPLYFAGDNVYLGVIAVADVLKDDSVAAIKLLQRMHLDVIMLTGDNELTGKAIADQAGIQHVITDVMPSEKLAVIQQLQQEKHHVLMVGDGINDAPALVMADVGMAIGAGTDIAVESADVVLMNSSLANVADAIRLSKATIRNIRQNLFWAFFYNILGIPIAAGVLYPAFGVQLSPMIGAAAMSLSSVFVVTNALRLRFFKVKHHAPATPITNQCQQEERSMETIIHVEGMMCPHCKARVESVCKSISGTVDAIVDLQMKQVTVTGTPDITTIKKAITDAGYQVVDL